MNWRALIVVVVLGVIIAWAIRTLQGWPEAEFTTEEKAMIEALAPVLDTLVLQQEDLSLLSGHYEPCEGGEAYALRYDYGYGGDSAEIEYVTPAKWDHGPIEYSSFCDVESGAYASSAVALPRTKEHLSFLRGAHADLARGGEGVLQELVQANSADLHPGQRVVRYRWLSAPTLGETRYAWTRTVADGETGEQFEIYDFHFGRGTLISSMGIWLPSSATAENEALSVALAFDDRIAAKLESLAADVQAP